MPSDSGQHSQDKPEILWCETCRRAYPKDALRHKDRQPLLNLLWLSQHFEELKSGASEIVCADGRRVIVGRFKPGECPYCHRQSR